MAGFELQCSVASIIGVSQSAWPYASFYLNKTKQFNIPRFEAEEFKYVIE
jgi:hypothetical protein